MSTLEQRGDARAGTAQDEQEHQASSSAWYKSRAVIKSKCRSAVEVQFKYRSSAGQIAKRKNNQFIIGISVLGRTGSINQPSGASLRSHQRRDIIRGLLRAQILGGGGSRDRRASRGHSSRGPAPLDLEGFQSARSAISSIQDLVWQGLAGAFTARSQGIFLGTTLRETDHWSRIRDAG
ncbi:hypothetical protein F511_28392 [Dorcoceras hygrometricum]|uniref:Uncharacterized protein n=1 Tax=Dorcoceras hygrometricum TaxID=472368 RepID=A0A2Z7CAM6_9LAMI|nr:hypothetical protein F511_28392 [Dorcoceras hygrometricum]